MTAKRAKTTAKRTKKSASSPPASEARAPRKTAARSAKRPSRIEGTGVIAGQTAKPRRERTLLDVILGALDELKALDVKVLDVRGLTDITDTMVVASGTSDRHVRSIVDRVVQRCKEAGFRPYGIEGERDGEWVLLDLSDVVLHVMLPRVREFYALEKLWTANEAAA